MDKWERHFASYQSLLKELAGMSGGSLRFGKNTLVASEIAEQFFCEKKVEMQNVLGEVETEAKILGNEAHSKLLKDAINVKRKELWRRIYGKSPVLALESLFVAKFNDLIVVGKPDSILFWNGIPHVVLEFKFSPRLVAYETHHVQARMYGLLLNSAGFDTRNLFYAIIVADPAAQPERNLKKKVLEVINKNGPKEGILELNDARVYLRKYNQEDAERELNWALKFWKHEREAIPTRNLNKCKKCEYFKKCQS